MWKDYSESFIRRNRASSVSITAAAFVATLFLSLLCGLFFNLWTYEIERIILEEGDWQGRITGEISEEDRARIENFANVERAVVNETLSEGTEIVVDVYFQNTRRIYQDMGLITELLGLDRVAASFHELLLSRYMIHDPEDREPPLLMAFYLTILLLVSLSLILIIRNSFEVSMGGRIHQFGILSSIGATPGQIRTCLMQEAAVLCLIPVLLGSLLGIGLCFGVIRVMNQFASEIPGRHEAVFQYHPLVFLTAVSLSLLTVLISAWLPARKLSRLTPLQAIRGIEEQGIKKKKRSPLLSLLFGVEGELAGNALRAQKKALRTAAVSLTLSFLGFTLMLCFFTLSGISTEHTYFEKYQDAWDVMATVKGTALEKFHPVSELRGLPGVESCVAYQKEGAVVRVAESELSQELNELGGPIALAGSSVEAEGGDYLIKAPLVIMDDAGFAAYCEQTGGTPGLDGTIILNRIWDRIDSNFRYKEYVPYVKEDLNRVTLRIEGQREEEVEIPVLACTETPPVLREEYENYALVQFLPLSLWKRISGGTGSGETDTYLRILGRKGVTLDELNELERGVVQAIGRDYVVESENRIQEKLANDTMIRGSMTILGAFCCLLALIGIASVFANAMGFLRQRKREFAQYLSLGMTPGELRKIFCVESLVIAGRPVLITIPVTAVAVSFMIKASYLEPMEFWAKAPVVPVLVFALAVLGFVALAYYLGGKRLLRRSLAEALREDYMG